MKTLFALVDCDNFYVSCERVFDARLLRQPVVVLSNNDACIISRSEEAKALGIRMGVPLFQVESLIDAHEVRVCSSNYALYGDMSARVMEVLQQFTPEVEVYSIDEAFLGVVVSESCDLTGLGRDIQRTVRKWTGLPVSVGLAETKTLAKLAVRWAKKGARAGGVLDLTHTARREYALAHTPVKDIWGIGRQRAKLLDARGITSARDLRDADLRWARKQMSLLGRCVVEELRGTSRLSLERCPPPRRSLTVSRSFGRPVESLAELRETVAVFTSRVAERLRRRQLVAGALTVFVSTSRFASDTPHYANSASVEMACPTDTTGELLERALACAEKLYRPGVRFKKSGVLLTALAPTPPITARLYDDARWERTRRLARVVDQLNAQMGRDTVRYAVAGFQRRWATKKEMMRQRYTTDWKELLAVKI